MGNHSNANVYTVLQSSTLLKKSHLPMLYCCFLFFLKYTFKYVFYAAEKHLLKSKTSAAVCTGLPWLVPVRYHARFIPATLNEFLCLSFRLSVSLSVGRLVRLLAVGSNSLFVYFKANVVLYLNLFTHFRCTTFRIRFDLATRVR